jgi:hypothetical protein
MRYMIQELLHIHTPICRYHLELHRRNLHDNYLLSPHHLCSSKDNLVDGVTNVFELRHVGLRLVEFLK